MSSNDNLSTSSDTGRFGFISDRPGNVVSKPWGQLLTDQMGFNILRKIKERTVRTWELKSRIDIRPKVHWQCLERSPHYIGDNRWVFLFLVTLGPHDRITTDSMRTYNDVTKNKNVILLLQVVVQQFSWTVSHCSVGLLFSGYFRRPLRIRDPNLNPVDLLRRIDVDLLLSPTLESPSSTSLTWTKPPTHPSKVLTHETPTLLPFPSLLRLTSEPERSFFYDVTVIVNPLTFLSMFNQHFSEVTLLQSKSFVTMEYIPKVTPLLRPSWFLYLLFKRSTHHTTKPMVVPETVTWTTWHCHR